MKKFLAVTILIFFFFTSCVKTVDPVDTNNATVELTSAGPKYVTGDITVNPKDSLIFSFTIASNKHMRYVSVQRNPTNQTAFLVRDTLSNANANLYTATKRFIAPDSSGSFLYRIQALDSTGAYIGHKDINVFVVADYIFYSMRTLQVPDTLEKNNKCYFSVQNGNTYSYTSAGAANSALIDFGYFFDTTKVTVNATLQPRGHTIYTLPANTFQPYDISGWTKNATLLKSSTATFANIMSATQIRAACLPALNSGTVTRFSQTDRGTAALISTGLTSQVLVFKTVAGKYGVMIVNFSGGISAEKATFINIDVKVEK